MLARSLAVLALALSLVPASQTQAQPPASQKSIEVDGQVALHSFMSLSDNHLQKMAQTLQVLADTEVARSGDWKQIEPRLKEVGDINLPAVLWFAHPDGSYWIVGKGKAEPNLSDRPYFPKLIGGKTIIGSLVIGKTSGRPSAVVAVPVRDANHKVVGALGGSIFLDQMSDLIRKEMGVGKGEIFYSFDSTPLLGLVWTRDMIMADPLSSPELQAPFREMLSSDEGIIHYTFRGKQRTVVYRRSPLTGWWYAFGVLPD